MLEMAQESGKKPPRLAAKCLIMLGKYETNVMVMLCKLKISCIEGQGFSQNKMRK
jgi:hypothetical protein